MRDHIVHIYKKTGVHNKQEFIDVLQAQNPQAVGFYERYGFATYRRTETDDQGGPYPLLHMRLQK